MPNNRQRTDRLISRRSFGMGMCAVFGSLSARSSAQAAAGRNKIVATADAALTQTVLVLGIDPVAICDIGFYRQFVIEPALPMSVRELGRRAEPNLELLNEIRPDLLLYSPEFGQLPTAAQGFTELISIPIYQSGSTGLLDAAIAATRSVAAVIGRMLEAGQYIESAERSFDEIRQRTQSFAGRNYCLFTFLTSRRVRVYTSGSLLGETLSRLGGTNVAAVSGNSWGFNDIGTEFLADYRADTFVHIGELAPDLAENPVWQSLPFVRQNRLLSVPTVWMFGGLPSSLRFAHAFARALGEA